MRGLLTLFLFTLQLHAQSFLIESIKIKSDKATIAPEAILVAAGLANGQKVTQQEIEAAARKLVDTGYLAFASFNYQTREVNGQQMAALTFEVTEAPRNTDVLLDFPGREQAELFQKLKDNHKFFTGPMPASDSATKLAVKELEELVGAPVETMLENDLQSHKNTLVFHLQYAPQIEAIEVAGNRTVSGSTVLGTITRLGVGQPYSDRRFRRLVELNVRPVYERLGRLEVQFRWLPPMIKDSAVTARFEIDEGQLYRLGNIRMAGETIEPDQMLISGQFVKGVANWEEIERSARKTLEPLRAQGYLGASVRILKNLRAEAGLVDITVEVKKSQQFIFGSLRVEGLPESDQKLAQTNLRLKVGEPYNDIYLRAYLRDYLTLISNKSKDLTQEMVARPGTSFIDLVWKFK